MNTTMSIEKATRRSFKQTTKEHLGHAIAKISTRRTRELFAAPVCQPDNVKDRLIMAHLKRRALTEKQEDFFERLHKNFWAGEGGAVFSQNCDHRFEDLFLARQKPDFDQIRTLWKQHQPEHIVEFGCNSGLLLNYMTSQLDGVKSATGIEINKEQVQQNQASSQLDPRINFVHADGGQWLLEHGKPNCMFVSNGGVLEYFRRERLDEMLTHISENLRPAIFFAVEPFANDHDWQQTPESVPFGEELSFSHNYTDLFQANGFDIQHQRAVEFDNWMMMATIAKCI